MSKTPFYKTGLGTYQGQTSDGALLYNSPLFLTEEEKLKLKEKGEKQYVDETTTTTSEKVKGGTKYTDTTEKDWTAKDEYEGDTLTFEKLQQQGGNVDKAKKWIKNNPEEYKKLLAEKNQTKTRTGSDQDINTRFVADPIEEEPNFAIDPDGSYNFDFYRESSHGDGRRATISNPGFTSFSNKSGAQVNDMLSAYKRQSGMIEKDYGVKTEQQWAEKRGWNVKQLQDGSELSKRRSAWIAKSQARHADLYKYNMPKAKILDNNTNQYYQVGSSGQLEPITTKS
tara:strand:- start:23618 stop:24466 length:849 start_codon:yes stop_codon:yes gene_type:complete